jgi:nitrilase
LRAAAEEAGVWVALGITERTPTGTLYNAVVYLDSSGNIAGLHRKLVPTGAERLVWANGTGPLLTVVDVGGVRVGSLICWEAYMPLARAALYQRGIDVLLIPTWDNSDEWVPTLRHIAKEGQVFVVGVTAHLRGCDVPRDLPGADEMYGGAEDHLSRGNTTIVAPGAGSSRGH